MARARDAGVETIVTIGCDLADSERALRTAADFGLHATIGIHPHEAKDAPADIAAAFDRLRAGTTAPIVAIGETGLDYHYNHSPADDQRRRAARADRLRPRCRIAGRVPPARGLRRLSSRVLREVWDRTAMRGVVHCFTGDAAQARTFVDEFGLLLGIGGVVTFKTAEPLREAVRTVGLDALVLETDCPYLAPVPHRGERNEPAFMRESARTVAAVLDVSLPDVVATTNATAARLFGLS